MTAVDVALGVITLVLLAVDTVQTRRLRRVVTPQQPQGSGYSEGWLDGYNSGRSRLAQDVLDHLDENGNPLPRSVQVVELDEYRAGRAAGIAHRLIRKHRPDGAS